MKNIFLSLILFSLCGVYSCKDASTSPKETKNFPTYKYSFTGTISNPGKIKIPDDAYFMIPWVVSNTSPDYGYLYGEGHIDTASNTFTIGFNDTLPQKAINLNKGNPGGLGVASPVFLVSSSFSKPTGVFQGSEMVGAKFWGYLDWTGFIYIDGETSQVEWRTWAQNFKQGYNFARAVKNTGQGFDYFVPATSQEMVLTIDTALKNYEAPNWTGINTGKHNSK